MAVIKICISVYGTKVSCGTTRTWWSSFGSDGKWLQWGKKIEFVDVFIPRLYLLIFMNIKISIKIFQPPGQPMMPNSMDPTRQGKPSCLWQYSPFSWHWRNLWKENGIHACVKESTQQKMSNIKIGLDCCDVEWIGVKLSSGKTVV